MEVTKSMRVRERFHEIGWMRELICDQFKLLRHALLRTFPCISFGFFVYHPNSDSKYVLAKVHLYIYFFLGGGGGEGRDENIRAPLAGRCFLRLSTRHLQFFYTP